MLESVGTSGPWTTPGRIVSDPDALSAPELILTLADSTTQPRLTAAGLVAAGALLGIDAGAIRVAAARLVKKGVLEQRTRGVYGLGRRGGEMHRRVQAWHRVEAQLAPWDGRWIGVFTGHLGRSDKSGLRARERALRLKGFAPARPGLAVRPANLRAHLPELRLELAELGLDPDALVLGIDLPDPHHPFDPRALWDTAALERRYLEHCAHLQASTARVPELDVQSAARETLLLGRAVMRDILTDPLLPEAMVDTARRRQMIEAMVAYDRLGKGCWRAFYRSLGR
jgi:phenylacetic acid degradation operon negative regulatory protein